MQSRAALNICMPEELGTGWDLKKSLVQISPLARLDDLRQTTLFYPQLSSYNMEVTILTYPAGLLCG